MDRLVVWTVCVCAYRLLDLDVCFSPLVSESKELPVAVSRRRERVERKEDF